MFFDIGGLEFLLLIVLAILVFGPEKLPRMIQDAARFLRKIRDFSDSAKQDIRNELGPEFKDFEFQDLNPRTFAKKHLMDGDELGLKELRNSLDVRKELSEVTDAVNGSRPSGRLDKGLKGISGPKTRAGGTAAGASGTAGGSGASSAAAGDGAGAGAARVSLGKDGDAPAAPASAPTPAPAADSDAAPAAPSFDLDAT